MNYSIQHKNAEQRDRRNSAIITLLISAQVFLGIFIYKFTKITVKPEEMTTMLINFGDNQNGESADEPADQEGSLPANTEISEPQPIENTIAETRAQPKVEAPKPVIKKKVITGSNTKASAPKNVTPKTASTPKSAPAKNSTSNAKTGSGDGKGTAAIGNLIKGRGTKPGTQGTNGTTGNQGDPLGGDGNGDSKIGVDRNLIGFIPGTMGRGGAQPAHSCSSSGTINISYTVDKAGNVISARRSGGTSDPCVVSTSVQWVKQYVKAERSNTSSTGTYRITF